MGLSSMMTIPAPITALTERLMPGAPGLPGATDAGVTNYIDLALAGLTKTSNTSIAAGSRNSTPIASKPTARHSAG